MLTSLISPLFVCIRQKNAEAEEWITLAQGTRVQKPNISLGTQETTAPTGVLSLPAGPLSALSIPPCSHHLTMIPPASRESTETAFRRTLSSFPLQTFVSSPSPACVFDSQVSAPNTTRARGGSQMVEISGYVR